MGFDKYITNVSMAAGVMPGSRAAEARFAGVAAVNRSATSVDIPGKKKSMLVGILMCASFLL